MKKIIGLMSIFLLSLSMVACGQKKQSERIGGPRGDRSGLNTTQLGQPIGGGSTEAGWSMIENRSEKVAVSYNSAKASRPGGQMIYQDEAIKGLLSSFMNINDPIDFGGVAANGAISFGGQLRFNGSQVDAANTRIGMVIFDQIAIQNNYNNAIRIYMGQERARIAGTIDASNIFTVVFEDDFGMIKMRGQISSGRIYADIYYKNNVQKSSHVTGTSEIYLGSIQVSQNGIIF